MSSKLLTQEEYQKITRKRHKYGVADAAERTYDGIVFDSKREMQVFEELYFMAKHFGQIERIDRQVRYPIVINKKRICDVVIDFKVTYKDGSVNAIEVKGVETPVWRLKKKLLLAMYPGLNLRVVK